MSRPNEPRIEWLTLGLVASTYLVWALATTLFSSLLWLAIPILALSVTLYSSLQHEVIHGHPTHVTAFNELLVFPALTLAIPYQRFRDDHLAHHHDERLTDPYDDPESNFLAPTQWDQQCRIRRFVLQVNNRLIGRLFLGPLIGQIRFMLSDAKAIRNGNPAILRGWLHHLVGLLPVVAWMIWVSEIPLWTLCLGTYAGLSIVKIRTFLEHRAHEQARARTVVIEDRGPLAFLFLNNNFHAVHHMHPRVPWYRLPRLYETNRAHYLRRNDGYRFASYGAVFSKYFLRAKDPVAHPMMEHEG